MIFNIAFSSHFPESVYSCFFSLQYMQQFTNLLKYYFIILSLLFVITINIYSLQYLSLKFLTHYILSVSFCFFEVSMFSQNGLEIVQKQKQCNISFAIYTLISTDSLFQCFFIHLGFFTLY